MARDMREQFIKASRLHFQAHIEKHRINVENLMENAVGVGEHPDLLTEVDKYVEMLESASGKLEVLNKYFMIEEDKSVLKG